MGKIELGIFDVDGTIRTSEGIPESIREGFQNLWSHNILTTVMTGRGYIRLQEMLGRHWRFLLSQSAPIGLENGGRITNNEGQAVQYFPLARPEIQGVFDVIARQEVQFLAAYPEMTRRPLLWAETPNKRGQLHNKYGYFADVIQGDITEAFQIVHAANPCAVSVKPNDLGMRTLFPADLNLVVNDEELCVNASGVNKGSSALEIANFVRIPASQTFVAGNDHNDQSMLDLPFGKKFFIGDNPLGLVTIPQEAIRITSPHEFGDYLTKFKQ